MKDTTDLVAEYAAVAAMRAQRITALVQERDALARAVIASPATVDHSTRVRELEAQVRQLRRRLRRYEAMRDRIESRRSGRLAMRVLRWARHLGKGRADA